MFSVLIQDSKIVHYVCSNTNVNLYLTCVVGIRLLREINVAPCFLVMRLEWPLQGDGIWRPVLHRLDATFPGSAVKLHKLHLGPAAWRDVFSVDKKTEVGP